MTPADFSASFPPRLDPKSRQQKPKVPHPPCHQTPRRPPPRTSLTFVTTSFFSKNFFYRNAQVTARGTIRIDVIHYWELTKSSPPAPSFVIFRITTNTPSPHPGIDWILSTTVAGRDLDERETQQGQRPKICVVFYDLKMSDGVPFLPCESS